MELTFKVFLFIHIISGTIGLLSGTLNMINKKGNKLHKQIGLFFFYGMLINGIYLESLHVVKFQKIILEPI